MPVRFWQEIQALLRRGDDTLARWESPVNRVGWLFNASCTFPHCRRGDLAIRALGSPSPRVLRHVWHPRAVGAVSMYRSLDAYRLVCGCWPS